MDNLFDYNKYPRINKEDLKIPQKLNEWFLKREWGEDYWREIPLNWVEWSDEQLKKYPIMNEILEWKKSKCQ